LYAGPIIYTGRDGNGYYAFEGFPSRAMAMITRIGYYFAFTMTAGTNYDIGKTAEKALLDAPYLPGTVAIRAILRLSACFSTATMADRAIFTPVNVNFLVTTEGGFYKGEI
jgi:hypothetical protein